MSRLMSVAYTEQQVRDRIKDVTRRKGWWITKSGIFMAKGGDQLVLVRKAMGRKPGEPIVRVAEVEVVTVRREPLGLLTGHHDPAHYGLPADYPETEVAREGFPGMHPAIFVKRFFRDAQGMTPDDDVTRIEWRYLDEVPS